MRTMDLIFKPNNNKELINAQKIGFNNGYRWYGEYMDGIKFINIDNCTYLIFSEHIDDNVEYQGENKNITSWRGSTPEQIIQINLPYNNGNYKYFDNYNNFKNEINHIKIDYNEPRKLVYENKDIQVIKFQDFTDFDNIEYRKGSKEYGGILIKLLEFLRIYKTNDSDTIEFNIKDFEKKSNMTIDEIKKLIESRESGQKLFDFDIVIDNNKLTISNLNKIGKNRPFESNNN